jgi:hypothetical protein
MMRKHSKERQSSEMWKLRGVNVVDTVQQGGHSDTQDTVRSGFITQERTRNYSDKMVVFRNILEQVNDGMLPYDFERAFDSTHRNRLWTIMRQYGIFEKLHGPDGQDRFLTTFSASSLTKAKLQIGSQWCPGETGLLHVRVTFLPSINWVMRKTRKGESTQTLEDLDSADEM